MTAVMLGFSCHYCLELMDRGLTRRIFLERGGLTVGYFGWSPPLEPIDYSGFSFFFYYIPSGGKVQRITHVLMRFVRDSFP